MVCYCGLNLHLITSETKLFLMSSGHMYVFYELTTHEICLFFYEADDICP